MSYSVDNICKYSFSMYIAVVLVLVCHWENTLLHFSYEKLLNCIHFLHIFSVSVCHFDVIFLDLMNIARLSLHFDLIFCLFVISTSCSFSLWSPALLLMWTSDGRERAGIFFCFCCFHQGGGEGGGGGEGLTLLEYFQGCNCPSCFWPISLFLLIVILVFLNLFVVPLLWIFLLNWSAL